MHGFTVGLKITQLGCDPETVFLSLYIHPPIKSCDNTTLNNNGNNNLWLYMPYYWKCVHNCYKYVLWSCCVSIYPRHCGFGYLDHHGEQHLLLSLGIKLLRRCHPAKCRCYAKHNNSLSHLQVFLPCWYQYIEVAEPRIQQSEWSFNHYSVAGMVIIVLLLRWCEVSIISKWS